MKSKKIIRFNMNRKKNNKTKQYVSNNGFVGFIKNLSENAILKIILGTVGIYLSFVSLISTQILKKFDYKTIIILIIGFIVILIIVFFIIYIAYLLKPKKRKTIGRDIIVEVKIFQKRNSITLKNIKQEILTREETGKLIGKHITIPNGYKEIGECAFFSRIDLESVIILEGIVTIGKMAFGNCANLSNIIISNSVTTINDSAFSGCSGLTNIIIPDGVTAINDSAFSDCDYLKIVIIPNSVKTIEGNPFFVCERLKKIKVSQDNDYYTDDKGVLIDKYKKTLICYPTNKISRTYEIPDSVEIIGMNSFYICNYLKDLTISDSVKTIESGAFSFIKKLNITIPGIETIIEENAFYDCKNLIVYCSEKSYAYKYCKIKKIKVKKL